MFDNLHECAYPGSLHYEIPPCQNLVTKNKIFCRKCFQSVTPAARKKWREVFPFDVAYDLVMMPGREDQREQVLKFAQSVTFAKRQLSLFGRKE